MTKPRGYLHSASEAFSCLLILSLLYYQPLFYSSLSRVILLCLLTFLLLFVAKHTEDIVQVFRHCFLAICAGVIRPRNYQTRRSYVLPIRCILDPVLTPLQKRPPPRLLTSRI